MYVILLPEINQKNDFLKTKVAFYKCENTWK